MKGAKDDVGAMFHRMRAAIAAKDVEGADQELELFGKFLGRQVVNPKLDSTERAGVFALGLATAALRRWVTKGKKR